MNIFRSHNHRKGFTLVELLVVIFIIGVLSAIIFPRFSGMREKARDTERMTDVRQIQNALELYYNRNNSYPISLTVLQTFKPEISITDPADNPYSYTRGGSCGVGSSLYSLRFNAENPATFQSDPTVSVSGQTVCIDLLRSI